MDIIDLECGCDTTGLTANMKKWMEKMQNSVNNPNLSLEELSWKDVSIYRVPAFVRDISHEIFTPELVSFGPYHHNNEELKKMEVHKERALIHFVRKAGRKAGKTLDDIVAAVDKVMKELQDSYYRLDKTWKSDRDGPSHFLKLMITDGCFMLEILEYAVNHGESYSPTDPEAYSPTDPFFSEHGVNHTMPYIRRDMQLIENQLPLLLLKTLVSVGRTDIHEDIDDYIHNLVLKFLKGGDEQVKKMGLRAHALDLLRHSLLTQNKTTKQSGKEGASGVIRSAVELREAGVRFRKSKTKSFRDIHFDPNKGILYLPELVVHDATECMLRNMVVFEHFRTNIDNGITSYVCFMDEIIDSAADVSLLHSRGIIQNSLGSDKQVAGLFNNRITKEVTVDPKCSLNEVREEVQKYCQRKWNKWRANLLHTYFRNPWSLLSLAGALLVIVLTILQTVFSGMQIYQG
ncbi:uncharacterized protein A4U43_C10F11380 [Asparagus officinalis]|uniref:Uncharacterized protein n=1 Tax=Asparagus officinalis TaxID=4686 RepID=A0A5P1E5D8_ASPOF|nr:UPF0481 protein At3g47200-like [Asparagus officinalis]ONK56665.1 uncharacterized protein A4U43_C10F11380 [Asparagus officinalis]